MPTRRIRRSPRIAQLALIALILIALPGHGRASFGQAGPGQTVEGRLLLLHADSFQHGHSTNSVALATDSGDLLKVDVSNLRDNEKLLGNRVRLAGDMQAGVFVASDGTTTSASSANQTTQATATAATTTHQTAVILLNFTNDASQPWTPSEISNLMFGSTNSVDSYYKESSYGNLSFAGTVFGWVTVPYDNTDCSYWLWGNAAQQAAGVDPTKYDNIVYIWPEAASCWWGGMGTLLGQQSWINGWADVEPIAHELGHNLGVHHAGSLECAENGVRVPLSAPANCHRNEYGDPFSVMGCSTRQWTNWNRAQLGWIPERINITSSGTYTIAPSEFTAQPRLLRIARGDGNYFYFEFRQPSGTYDAFSPTDSSVNGVLVRLAPDTTSVAQSALLDGTPATSTLRDAAFVIGKGFTDPVSGVSITTTAVTPQGATINVSFGGGGGTGGSDTIAPTAPTSPRATATTTSVSLSWTASTDDVGVAGYRIARDDASVGTATAASFADSALSPGTTYRYAVTAYDAAGNTSAAAQVSITTQALKAPSTPKALVIGTTQVALSWAPNADSQGVAAYEIYRDGFMVGESALPNWLDQDQSPGSSHKYQVRARDAGGNRSPLSSTLSLRLLGLSTASTGTLAGVVYNALGRPQANAVVQLAGNGLAKSAKTGTSGTYKFGSLPSGSYTVTITRPATTGAAAASAAALPATVAPGVTLVVVA